MYSFIQIFHNRTVCLYQREDEMTLYKLLEQISEVLTPQMHSLYDYLLHSSDDNGFLRTRHCYWHTPLPDHGVPDLRQALICFRQQFCDGDAYYDGNRKHSC